MHRLDNFDIAQLRFLQALLDTQAITRAGELLGLSQPAASRAMMRLRRHFSDPLLVRTTRGYALTPVAELLRPAVRTAMASMDALFEVSAFDAKASNRTFRIASTDYGISVALMPRLESLRKLGPSIAWQIEPWSDETTAKLERGELDCALYSDESLPADFHYRKLFSDGYALVCHKQHPLTLFKKSGAKVLLMEAAKYPQCAPRYLASRRYVTDNLYERLGLAPSPIVVASPYFYTALESVIRDDWVAVVPAKLAGLWAQRYAIAVIPITEKSLQFEYRLIWHERAHRDRGLQWLREQFAR